VPDSVVRLGPPHGGDTPGETPYEPEWFKKAVFYEVLVRSFYDSNSDGIGDLRGLAAKLDYLQWLGVDCLWLPPFYSSPLNDGGYDISDYRAVLPEYGVIDHFVELTSAAHARGIRVITDLVMNHTSDQHLWFQESRRDRNGPFGDFYMWADHDRGYPNSRVIFVDTEDSVWTHDPMRQQYYFHRFFSHQPDLNYENPRVRDAMFDVLRFWLDLGIDGFRMDAVPYLFSEEGTDGENLPQTHAFLRLIRKAVDEEYPGTLLLVEANQWPVLAAEYFGDPSTGGDEAHMAFHFPLMPRIFTALRREDAGPVSDVLAQTPRIPSGGQWAIFLRNHDELTLEMVTDTERAYMYAQYANEPRMRANVGIRRRLAPLLDNDREQIELLTALLLSLPGSPVLYYGDEIGMGDNIRLNDRDGVRTPMQWNAGRNAGFSAAGPDHLILPVINDSRYGSATVNVESQMASESSLLHWTRRMLLIRRSHPAFGLGTYEEIDTGNKSVLAYSRHLARPDGPGQMIVCVNNLARDAQTVTLELAAAAGSVPVNLAGTTTFSGCASSQPHRLTLPGHGFLWLSIQPASNPDGEMQR
jgi:maltose alpha-D-glucosyltransferase/alpha-amylase